MNENYKTCRCCNSSSPAAHAFCTRCGSPFSATLVHPNRGYQHDSGGAGVLAPYQPQYAVSLIPTNCFRKTPGTHSVAAASVLSILLVGAGQCYNQQFAKGAAFFLANILLGLCTHGASVLVMWLFCSLEAGITASRINRGEWVSKW